MDRVCQCGKPMTYLEDDIDPYLPEGEENQEIWQCSNTPPHQHTFPKEEKE